MNQFLLDSKITSFFQLIDETLAGIARGSDEFLTIEIALIWCGVPESVVLKIRSDFGERNGDVDRCLKYRNLLFASDDSVVDKYGIRAEFDQAVPIIHYALFQDHLDYRPAQHELFIRRDCFVDFVRLHYPATIVGGSETLEEIKMRASDALAVVIEPESENLGVINENLKADLKNVITELDTVKNALVIAEKKIQNSANAKGKNADRKLDPHQILTKNQKIPTPVNATPAKLRYAPL